MAKFKYFPIQIIKPNFHSELVDLVIYLDVFRSKKLQGTTSSRIFFQLKSLYNTLESIYSARIEGNH